MNGNGLLAGTLTPRLLSFEVYVNLARNIVFFITLIALRMAETLYNFGCSECNRVRHAHCLYSI